MRKVWLWHTLSLTQPPSFILPIKYIFNWRDGGKPGPNGWHVSSRGVEAGQGTVRSRSSDQSRESGSGNLPMGKVVSGQVKEWEGFFYISDLFLPPCPLQASVTLPQLPAPQGAGVIFVELLNIFPWAPNRISPASSRTGCMIRNPGSATNSKRSDIPAVYARINRAWHRAARSCPRANTALCQIWNCFCKGSVCAWWVREEQLHQTP